MIPTFLDPDTLCILLFLALLFVLVIAGLKLEVLRGLVRANWLVVIPLLAVTLLAKFPYDDKFFFGLEYEDAFVYNAFSRQLLFDNDFLTDPFLTKGCVAGSLSDCQFLGTYSAHLIGFPSVVSAVHRIYGFNKYTISWFNLVSTLFSVVLLFLVAYTIKPDKVYCLVSSAIFAVTPVVSLFHTSSLSESFSSTLVLLVLLLYLIRTEHPDGQESYLLAVCLILSIFCATLVKRENLALLLLPFVTVAGAYWGRRISLRSLMKTLAPYLIASAVIVMFFLAAVDLGETVSAERGDIDGFPFQFEFFYPNFMAFMEAFFKYNWFGIFGYLLPLGFVAMIWDFKRNHLLLYPVAVFLLYLSLYGFHYRSYFFIQTGTVDAFLFLRYITNFFPLFCLIVSYGVVRVVGFIVGRLHDVPRTYGGPVVVIAGLVYCLILGVRTDALRTEFWNAEQESRIEPVNESIKFLQSESDIVITDQTLLFQILGPEDLRTIDLQLLGDLFSEQQIRQLATESNLYYLEKEFHQDNLLINRFPHAFALLDVMDKTKVLGPEEGAFRLFRIR